MAILIGKYLRKLRQSKNLTQEKLAEHLNVSSKAVSKWESDNGIPDIDNLKALSDFFSVSIDDIINARMLEYADSKPEEESVPKIEDWRGGEFQLKWFALVYMLAGYIVITRLVEGASAVYTMSSPGLIFLIWTCFFFVTVVFCTVDFFAKFKWAATVYPILSGLCFLTAFIATFFALNVHVFAWMYFALLSGISLSLLLDSLKEILVGKRIKMLLSIVKISCLTIIALVGPITLMLLNKVGEWEDIILVGMPMTLFAMLTEECCRLLPRRKNELKITVAVFLAIAIASVCLYSLRPPGPMYLESVAAWLAEFNGVLVIFPPAAAAAYVLQFLVSKKIYITRILTSICLTAASAGFLMRAITSLSVNLALGHNAWLPVNAYSLVSALLFGVYAVVNVLPSRRGGK